MCIIGADGFNISMVISQHDAKILTEILTKVSGTNLIEAGLENNRSAHEMLSATSGFISNVTNVLTTLQDVRDKHEKEEAFRKAEGTTIN